MLRQFVELCSIMITGPYCITGEVSLGLKRDIPGHNLIVSVLECSNITEKVLITGAVQGKNTMNFQGRYLRLHELR